MECDRPLSDFHQLYIAGALPKKKLEGILFQHLLNNLEQFRLFEGDIDLWNDFLSWLYPRLARAIDLYKDLGSSFDAYITSLVNSAAKEYRCRENDHKITEHVCWCAKAEEMELFESEPEYTESKTDISIPGFINPKQILFLLLKSYFFVSDEFVEQVAGAIGMNIDSVKGMINELRKRRSKKEEEIRGLKERLYCQHYRCLAYQKRMLNALEGTEYHQKMKLRHERARKRYRSMKKRLEGMRMSASNRMIADVVGIPRGTVDSSLFAIKNRFNHDLKSSI
jgi:hypothetical protein